MERLPFTHVGMLVILLTLNQKSLLPLTVGRLTLSDAVGESLLEHYCVAKLSMVSGTFEQCF